jgi:hypothetical protein
VSKEEVPALHKANKTVKCTRISLSPPWKRREVSHSRVVGVIGPDSPAQTECLSFPSVDKKIVSKEEVPALPKDNKLSKL